MTVAVITGDVPPLGTLGANGAGIRAWGMAAALRRLGHDAVLVYPAGHAGGAEPPRVRHHVALPRGDMAAHVLSWEVGHRLTDDEGTVHQITAIIFQHWGVMAEVLGAMGAEERSLPIAVDLAGPHLLERHYGGSHDAANSLRDKLRALARAEFATVGGRRQLAWFAPFLAAAWGTQPQFASEHDVTFEGRVGVADFYIEDLLPVEPWRFRDDERPVILYSGAFLPWQDPTWAIRETIAFLDELGRGELLILGALYPGVRGSDSLTALEAELNLHPRVRRIGRAPFCEALAATAGADAALDLMAPNPERMLAMPTRSFVYRRLRLPTIHATYGEAATFFTEGVGGTGWAISFGDREALRGALGEVAGEMGGIARRRRQEWLALPPDQTTVRAAATQAVGAYAAWLERVVRGERPAASSSSWMTTSRETARELLGKAAAALGFGDDVRAAADEGLALGMPDVEGARGTEPTACSARPTAGRRSDASTFEPPAHDPKAAARWRSRHPVRRVLAMLGAPVAAAAGLVAMLWLAFVSPKGRRAGSHPGKHDRRG